MLNLHSDGCIVSNMSVKAYDVTVIGKCDHTKFLRAVITLDAESADDAKSFVETWLKIPQTKIPQTMVIGVAESIVTR
jgi:hypothetical protein